MTEPMRTILESEFLGLHTVLRQRLVRIDQLEAALRDLVELADISKPIDADALTGRVRRAYEALKGSAPETPIAQSKSQQKRLDTMRARIVTETADAIAAQSETKAYPPWFGSPTLIDRIDASMSRGLPYEEALQECADWAELRSEVIFQLRQYYEPKTKGDDRG